MALHGILNIHSGKFQRYYSLDRYSPHQSRGFGAGNSVMDPSGMLESVGGNRWHATDEGTYFIVSVVSVTSADFEGSGNNLAK